MKFARPSGLMFHHFQGGSHLPAQGSITASTFGRILDLVSHENSLLCAKEWLTRANSDTLSSDDLCITFDDALACQYDIALPVLRERGLTAFWFVYTSVLEGNVEPLEIFRLFRTSRFSDIDTFYRVFFECVESYLDNRYHASRKNFDPNLYLRHAPFYSESDRWFRYLRDECLNFDEYQKLMYQMMEDAEFSIDDARENLWLTQNNIRELAASDHVVGLHSHTHPTTMAKLSFHQQFKEYSRNSEHLAGLLGSKPQTVSHPCNSYSNVTLQILSSLGISIGFRANTQPVERRSKLEFAREDHANICNLMKRTGEIVE